MKSTWPTPALRVGDPTAPRFPWLALGFCVGGNANLMFCVGGNASFSIFRYQHVGIPNAKSTHWGCYPTPDPNSKGLASQ